MLWIAAGLFYSEVTVGHPSITNGAVQSTVAYDYQNEWKINPPTQVLNDVAVWSEPIPTSGGVSDGRHKIGSDREDWIPMIQRLNDDFAYITNVMRWRDNAPERLLQYGLSYGSGLSTDNASNTETGGWQGTTWYNGQAWPMILASYYPVHCFDPPIPEATNPIKPAPLVHEGIHCICPVCPDAQTPPGFMRAAILGCREQWKPRNPEISPELAG